MQIGREKRVLPFSFFAFFSIFPLYLQRRLLQTTRDETFHSIPHGEQRINHKEIEETKLKKTISCKMNQYGYRNH
jgi:hypothetical protein